MNHKLFFLVALFVAVVGVALITADTEAGHRCRCSCACSCDCSCYSSCNGCHGCNGCYGCYGCHGGWGCNGCHGCYAPAPVVKEVAPPAASYRKPAATPITASRSQFGFRTAQFVR